MEMDPKVKNSIDKFLIATAFCILLTGLLRNSAHAQSGLQVTFGAKGVQKISYQGTTLENVDQFPGDAFHIWHTKLTDLKGNVLGGSDGQYGWGENNSGEMWDAESNTETYRYSWGTIAVTFAQNGSNLNMTVTETNNAGSGVILNGAEIYPFALHFPMDPKGFSGYTQYAITTTEPGVSTADFGSGVVTSVIPDESLPLYGGWKVSGTATYSPIMTSTAPDGLATFLPHDDVPVMPGSSLSYTISLRFAPEGSSPSAADAYASFAAKYPSQIAWSDRRAIGTAYLASSPANTGDGTQAGGFPTNPRRYFNDSTIDVTSAAGLQAFQNRMLTQAANNVVNAQALDGQGVITWDIEGEQFPQSTSYVCSPDQIATVAPEMESTITDKNSTFFGQKLDDAYFKTMSGAGLKIGLCLRPQMFTMTPDGRANQIDLGNNAAIIANLENKAKFANFRWGATIFYVDSTVDVNGGTLDPAIFQQLITDLPSFLFIPEESTPRYYAYSAPFYSFLFHTDLGTPASIYEIYPQAFGVNLVNDVTAATLAANLPQLTAAVTKGDVLMGHVDYWQDNDPTIVSVYRAAGVTTPSPGQTTPAITWNDPPDVTYGTALSAAQLNAAASVPGTFTYTPVAGTVLRSGVNTLSTTFTPTDAAKYRTTTASVKITVTPAAPVVTWPAPANLSYGSPLSADQLNAKTNVPGSFLYTPAAGAVLSAGSNTLSVTFTPTDSTDYRMHTASVVLTIDAASAPTTPAPTAPEPTSPSPTTPVTPTPTPPAPVSPTPDPNSPLAILSPSPGDTISGTIAVAAQLNLALDAAESYLMVDGNEVGTGRVGGAPYQYPLDTTTLSNGVHVLQLWAHDIGNSTVLSATVTVNVVN